MRDAIGAPSAAPGAGAAESIWIRAELDLHCACWGDPEASPVLLVHGNGGHAHWWAPLIPELARQHRVLSLDLRGHGLSQRPAEVAYALEDYERDLGAVWDALALPQLPIIAHSMGGRAVLFYAARHSQRVRGVALLDTSLGGIDGETAASFRPKVAGRRDGGSYPSRQAAVGAFRFVPPEPDVPESVRLELAHHAIRERAPGDWRMRFDRGVLMGDGHGDVIDLVERIAGPVWIAVGRDSRPLSSRQRDRILALRPDAVLETFAGAHHFFLSNPESVSAWLDRFLTAADAQA